MDLEQEKKRFENHKATLTDYGDIKILDFKNPESSDYRIRFLFEEKYCRLHITGDLGDLIASNYNNMRYAKFDDFVNDVGYFEGKIDCHSRPLYRFDEDTARKQLIEFFDDNGIETEDKDRRELLVYELMECFDDGKGLSDKGISMLTDYICDDYEAYSFGSKLGLVSTGILDLYMLAFKLAKKQLDEHEAGTKDLPDFDKNYLFRGQTRRFGEKVKNMRGDPMESNWEYGGVFFGCGDFSIIYSYNPVDKFVVYTDTVCQYTGRKEFTLDSGYGKKLFENDIVEIWQDRSIYGVRQSKSDGLVKVRGVIRQKNCGFYIDLNNPYNEDIFKSKGLEEYDRQFRKMVYLQEFTLYDEASIKWQREHNAHCIRNDIVIIGNIFDNPELLEVSACLK